jgi:hypothetical protein
VLIVITLGDEPLMGFLVDEDGGDSIKGWLAFESYQKQAKNRLNVS